MKPATSAVTESDSLFAAALLLLRLVCLVLLGLFLLRVMDRAFGIGAHLARLALVDAIVDERLFCVTARLVLRPFRLLRVGLLGLTSTYSFREVSSHLPVAGRSWC